MLGRGSRKETLYENRTHKKKSARSNIKGVVGEALANRGFGKGRGIPRTEEEGAAHSCAPGNGIWENVALDEVSKGKNWTEREKVPITKSWKRRATPSKFRRRTLGCSPKHYQNI